MNNEERVWRRSPITPEVVEAGHMANSYVTVIIFDGELPEYI